MDVNVNTLISLGILGVVSFALRGVFALREDMREVKTTLGINGSKDTGLVAEVGRLRVARHSLANDITAVAGDVALVKQHLKL